MHASVKQISPHRTGDFLTWEIPDFTERGFYSVYSLVPEKMGEFRPILDIKDIVRKPFHMLTTKKLLELVHQGN